MTTKDIFRKMQHNQGNSRVDEEEYSTVESMTRGTAQWELGKLSTKEKEISRKMKSFKNNMEIGSPLRKKDIHRRTKGSTSQSTKQIRTGETQRGSKWKPYI